MSEITRLAIIIGSVRQGRFGPVAAAWVAQQAHNHGGFDVDVIDLAGIDIPLVLPGGSPKLAGDDYPDYAAAMLVQLDWWANALRTARAETPYPT